MRSSAEKWTIGHTWKEKSGQSLLTDAGGTNGKLDSIHKEELIEPSGSFWARTFEPKILYGHRRWNGVHVSHNDCCWIPVQCSDMMSSPTFLLTMCVLEQLVNMCQIAATCLCAASLCLCLPAWIAAPVWIALGRDARAGLSVNRPPFEYTTSRAPHTAVSSSNVTLYCDALSMAAKSSTVFLVFLQYSAVQCTCTVIYVRGRERLGRTDKTYDHGMTLRCFWSSMK